jgi:5-methylcytosine-specific restriction endonuclease McrA
MSKPQLQAKFFVKPNGDVIAKAKRYIPFATKKNIYSKYNGHCCECGIKTQFFLGNSGGRNFEILNAHIDHIVPISRGGQNEIENLRLMCNKCNCSKGAK